MTTTKPKSTKTEVEPGPVEIQPPAEKRVNKRAPVKASTSTSTAIAQTNEAAKTDEKEFKTSKKSKNSKGKVIRDSFSFPEQDYLKISEIKKNCLAEGIHVKKGEILRAGLLLLTKLSLAELKQAVKQVEKVKTGRPNASKIQQ
ncbi:MAG: hypothetical protein PHG00_01235 [Methylococcales bacterium]|nr:hypothetical protein [Methylococcales bacterium]